MKFNINSKSVKSLIAGASLLALPALSLAAVGAAGAENLDTLVSSWSSTLQTILTFTQFFAGFGGVVLVIIGLFQLKNGHSSQGGGQQAQTKSGFIYVILGGSMLVVGTLAAVLSNTVASTATDTVANHLSQFDGTGNP